VSKYARLLSLVSTVALVRFTLDAVLIVSWAWLASEYISHALALIGVGAFTGVFAWFWAIHFDKWDTEKPSPPVAIEAPAPASIRSLAAAPVRATAPKPAPKGAAAREAPAKSSRNGRLETFVRRGEAPRVGGMQESNTGLHELWYLESRLEEEARRSMQRGLSLAVIVLRFQPIEVSDWTSDAWREKSIGLATRWVQALSGCDLAAPISPNELAICLFETGRPEAEMRLETAANEIAESCDACLVIFPDEHPESSSLIQLARLRAQPADDAIALRQ